MAESQGVEGQKAKQESRSEYETREELPSFEGTSRIHQAQVQRARRNPSHLGAADMRALQRTIGNRAVQRLIQREEESPPTVIPIQRTPPNGRVKEIQRNPWKNYRKDWKGMGRGEKAMAFATSPLNAIPGAIAGAGYLGSGAYRGVMKGGGAKPSRLRKAGAVVAGGLGGLAGGIGGAIAGGLWGIANPLWSGAKYAGSKMKQGGKYLYNKARGIPEGLDTARGIFPGVNNASATSKTEIGDLTGKGATVGGSGGRVLVDVANMIDRGNMGASSFQSSLSGASSAFGGLGGAAGGLAAGGALLESGYGMNQMRDTNLGGSDRLEGGLRMTSGLADATKSSSTSAMNISNMVGNTTAVGGATLAAGGAGVAMGAIDMLRGGYGVYKGGKREKQLMELSQRIGSGTERGKMLKQSAKLGASTQSNRKSAGWINLAKGAASIIGGSLLLASMATPVGWALLGGAALLGGIGAYMGYRNRKNRKKQMGMELLGERDPTLIERRRVWKEEKKKIEKETWPLTEERERRMAALGEDPREVALKEGNYKSIGHVYAEHKEKLANELYTAVLETEPPDPEAMQILSGMGLKVNKDKGQPTKESIQKALHE